MNIRRKFSLAVITFGITVVTVGCSASPASAPEMISFDPVAVEQSQILAPDIHLDFPKSEVTTIAAPVMFSPVRKTSEVAVKPVDESPVTATPTVKTPVTPAPVTNTPAAPAHPTPVTQPAPVVVPVAPAVDREVYVGLAGGQSIVDLGRGPVLFPLTGGVFPPYVAEHDFMGGWQRFGTLKKGMTVRMSGLVTGTYTVGKIINVPKGGSTDEFRQFNTMPKVLLQTCVPRTNRMIVVGLY
jgi:hypothetical protein